MNFLSGYVIPRKGNSAVKMGAAVQCEQSRPLAALGIEYRRRSAKISSWRCIFCKDLHDPKKYCFRLRTVKTMPKRKRGDSSSSSESSESGQLNDSTDGRDSSVDRSRSEDDGGDKSEADKQVEDSFGPPYGSLEGFYGGKKRIDAYDVRLMLRPETIKMYFEKLLADGKMDQESARKLHKKYYMSDKDFSKIAPPSLSATKLHEIQSHDLGGVHSRLMGIHVSMRSALKVILRSYESLGGVNEIFGPYKSAHAYSPDGEVSDRFLLPNRRDLLDSVTEAEIEQEMPINEGDIVDIVKEKIMLSKLAEQQASMCVELLGELDTADKVACLGQKQHMTLEELLWDSLQYLGQLDLTIKDAREAKIEEYLTAGFKSSLKAANKDKTIKSARHKKDVLLHPKLDKMVKEEARSNSKVGCR